MDKLPPFKRVIASISRPTMLVSVLLTLVPLVLLAVYLKINAENIAWADETRLLDYVLAFRRGEFSFLDLFTNISGQYSVTSFAVVILVAALTRWNILVEVALNVVAAAVTLLCLVWLVRRARPEILPFILPAFGLLLFSVHQDINWLGAYHGHWFYSNLWFLLAFMLVVKYPQSWAALIGAGLLAFLTTLSSANGSLAWYSIGLYLLLTRPHNWKQLLLWGAGTIAATLIAYFMAEARLPTSLISPFTLIAFALEYLGAAFVSRFWLGSGIGLGVIALGIGGLGVTVFFLNAAYLWFVDGDRRTPLLLLVPASYGGAAGLLVGLSNIPAGLVDYGPFISWYATLSNMFWMGYLVLAFAVIWAAYHGDSSFAWRKAFGLANLVGLIALFTLFIIQNHRITETSYLSSDPDNWGAGTPITDNCALQYVFSLEDECLAEFVYVADQVAPYRLNIYAHQDPTNMLPADYLPGEPIVVETARTWHAVHVRDWLLAGVPPEDVLFVFPGDAADIAEIPAPLANVAADYRGGRADQLAEFLGDHPTVWYIRKKTAPSYAAAAIDALGYSEVEEYRHDPGDFIIVKYEK